MKKTEILQERKQTYRIILIEETLPNRNVLILRQSRVSQGNRNNNNKEKMMKHFIARPTSPILICRTGVTSPDLSLRTRR